MLREGTVIEGLRCGAGADGGRKQGMKGAIAKADELAAGNKRQLYPGGSLSMRKTRAHL